MAAYSPSTAPLSMSAAHRSSPAVPARHLPPEHPWSLPSHHQCSPPQNLQGVTGGREQFIQLPARSRKWRSPPMTLNSGPLFPLPDELEDEDEVPEDDDEELLEDPRRFFFPPLPFLAFLSAFFSFFRAFFLSALALSFSYSFPALSSFRMISRMSWRTSGISSGGPVSSSMPRWYSISLVSILVHLGAPVLRRERLRAYGVRADDLVRSLSFPWLASVPSPSSSSTRSLSHWGLGAWFGAK